jgi:hypothetical protein
MAFKTHLILSTWALATFLPNAFAQCERFQPGLYQLQLVNEIELNDQGIQLPGLESPAFAGQMISISNLGEHYFRFVLRTTQMDIVEIGAPFGADCPNGNLLIARDSTAAGEYPTGTHQEWIFEIDGDSNQRIDLELTRRISGQNLGALAQPSQGTTGEPVTLIPNFETETLHVNFIRLTN